MLSWQLPYQGRHTFLRCHALIFQMQICPYIGNMCLKNRLSLEWQQPQDLFKLGKRLEEIDRLKATHSNRTFYLSVAPKFYGSACKALTAAGLLNAPKRSRVVIE